MFDSVLLPIDLGHSASWEKALPIAQRVMAANGTLHVLAVVHDLGSAMVATYLPDGFEQDTIRRMQSDLEHFAEKELPAGAQVHVGHGAVAETILKMATDLGADLVVMASHPPTALRNLLVGSYADEVVRHAHIPVLVVR